MPEDELVHAAGILVAFLLFLVVNPLLVTRAEFVLQEPALLLFPTIALWRSVRWMNRPSRIPASFPVAGALTGTRRTRSVVAPQFARIFREGM